MSNELPRAFGPTYTLLKLLARGGMGEIYLARTAGITGFEKYYAVKKLLKKFTHDNDVGARFIDEAKLGARLQHPNIVQVYDLGRVNDELYMATEFVDGFDLRRVLRFCHEKKKRIPLDIALFIVREILSGLAYAHRQVDAEGHSINLIHRDISPQNVLVSFEGEVKIIDFGLAKSTQRSQETQANVLLGNFGYMSPEQARGHVLDVRTDVYSAGIVLFELVTGTKRFVEENPLRLLEMVARPTPIVPSDRVAGTPKTIDRIYTKATSPAKEERYDGAEAFRDDVTAALHKINPKASRENLAQFLNHLFLGGAAPAPIDADVLDKSVAIRVRDLHEASDAFQQPVESDVRNRSLAEFSDEAPQTASHPLMRQARAGDVLTHAQLTGEEAVAPPVAPAPRATAIASPPLSAAVAAAPPAPAAAPPPLPSPLPSAPPAPAPLVAAPLASPPPLGPPSAPSQPNRLLVVSPEEAMSIVGMPTSISALPDVGSALGEVDALPLGDGDPPPEMIVDLGPIAETPTSIYDSPEWPGELDRAAAEADPGDVQQQIEAELQRQLEAQAEVQRQLEAQAEAERQSAERAAAERAAAERAAAEWAAAAPPPPPPPPPRAGPPPEQSGVHRAPQVSRGQVVVTTVGPPPKRPVVPAPEQPSIVVSMELDPSEPTVVGGSALTQVGDTARTVELSPLNDRARSGGGFQEGAVHESLIIDFDGGEAEPVAPSEESAKNIRPAAQPLGRRVVSAIAQPAKRTTNPRGTPVADEAPSSMPPPTRRR